jgi:hypothetical protein
MCMGMCMYECVLCIATLTLRPSPLAPHAAGDLRGHGNQGPPWRTADIAVASTELLLQPLPTDLLHGAGLHANGTSLPRGAHDAAQYSLLSVDSHAATTTSYRPSAPQRLSLPSLPSLPLTLPYTCP